MFIALITRPTMNSSKADCPFLRPNAWELTALAAARRVEHVEVMFAVLAALELEVDAVRERQKALGASETSLFSEVVRHVGTKHHLLPTPAVVLFRKMFIRDGKRTSLFQNVHIFGAKFNSLRLSEGLIRCF